MSPWSKKEKGNVKESSKGETGIAQTSRDQPLVQTQRELVVKPESSAVHEKDPTEGEYGFRPVKDPKNALADIIFIHGLTGNRETTWTRNVGKRNACFWPEDLLPENIPNARIATWGYDADVINGRPFRVVSTNTVEQHAANLCTDLANLRKESGRKRPIIFVVHSLGGLVCKTALLHSAEARTEEYAYIKEISESTHGILFMGTPHQDSAHASWGGMLASILGFVKQDNVGIVQGLEKEAPHLAELQKRFYTFLANRKQEGSAINITCFHEELPVAVLGTIVPALSATMNGYEAIGVRANHMDMTKFGSDDSLGYTKALGELQRWMTTANSRDEKAGQKGKEQAASSNLPAGSHFTHHGNVTDGGVAIIGSQSFSGQTTIGGTCHRPQPAIYRNLRGEQKEAWRNAARTVTSSRYDKTS